LNVMIIQLTNDPSLGFVTKAKTWKGASWKCNLRVTFAFPGMWGEWAHTLPRGLPLWELKSRWISEFSKKNFRGQNSLN
jgi:hypothetical protein